MPVIDFSQVKGPEPLPAGEYLVKVVHAEEGVSNRSQQPKIDYRLEVIAPEEYSGRQIFDTLSFHPDAMRNVKQKLIGFGFGRDFSGEVNAASLLDKEAAVTVEIEAGQPIPDGEPGETYPDRNRVRKIRTADKYGKGNVASAALEEMVVEPVAEPSTGRRGRNK
jgi:hypothetical protein